MQTKKKTTITGKIELLVKLMKEYLHIKETEVVTPESFISEMVDMPVDEVKDLMEIYEEDLDKLEDNIIRDGSKLKDVSNRLSLLAILAYAYQNDLALDEWLEDYAAKNNTYYTDQSLNFNHMVKSLTAYNQREAVA